MIPSIVYTSHDLQTDFHKDEAKLHLTVSRGREVTIVNSGLEEGLYLFKYHEADKVYKGVPTYTSSLAAIKLKALAQGETVTAPVRKTYRKAISLADIPKSILDSLLSKDLSQRDIEELSFEIKAQEPIKITTRRNDITSIEIENQFRSGAAYRPSGRSEQSYELVQDMEDTNEDVFLAYIFKEQSRHLVLIDIGELWDTRRISFDDLLDILTHSKLRRADVKDWARNLGALTPEQKKEMSDNYDTSQRTKAFDDIMKQNNPNFDSNKEN